MNDFGGEAAAGQVVAGRYRLTRKLGGGGFGRVWLARDEEFRVDVAIKQVWVPESASAAEQQERLLRAQREARNTAQLRDHPNVVTVYDVVIDGGAPWTVMQLVRGSSLQEQLDLHGPLPESQAVKVASGVLDALGAAHAAGIVHRDVKPANVLLSENGGVLLTDFGIAVAQADTALTATNTFIGSVEYIAPERARGGDAGPESDLFSLGVTLYQALSGKSPFRRDSTVGSLTAVLFEEPAPLSGSAFADLVMALMAKDPGARPTVAQASAWSNGSGGPHPSAAPRPTAVAPTLQARHPTTPAAPAPVTVPATPAVTAAARKPAHRLLRHLLPLAITAATFPMPLFGFEGGGQVRWTDLLQNGKHKELPYLTLALMVVTVGITFNLNPRTSLGTRKVGAVAAFCLLPAAVVALSWYWLTHYLTVNIGIVLIWIVTLLAAAQFVSGVARVGRSR